jgi:hypothetical protein
MTIGCSGARTSGLVRLPWDDRAGPLNLALAVMDIALFFVRLRQASLPKPHY